MQMCGNISITTNGKNQRSEYTCMAYDRSVCTIARNYEIPMKQFDSYAQKKTPHSLL